VVGTPALPVPELLFMLLPPVLPELVPEGPPVLLLFPVPLMPVVPDVAPEVPAALPELAPAVPPAPPAPPLPPPCANAREPELARTAAITTLINFILLPFIAEHECNRRSHMPFLGRVCDGRAPGIRHGEEKLVRIVIKHERENS
jgi:hypothetical protein